MSPAEMDAALVALVADAAMRAATLARPPHPGSGLAVLCFAAVAATNDADELRRLRGAVDRRIRALQGREAGSAVEPAAADHFSVNLRRKP